MAVALHENRPVRGEEAIVERPDGSRAWFAPYPTPLRDELGRLVGAVNVLIDVTERRQAEQELRRTAAALETSNAVKDEFLGLVSHELRTPVTTIFGNARLLQDRGDSLPADLRAGMVADIAEDAERLHSLIENLLQLTRVGSGTEPELEPQVADRVVRRAIATFRRRRPDRRVAFRGGTEGAIVEADGTWLELVIGNLLSNADKYSPTETPIVVRVTHGADEVEVTVSDQGIGFDRDAVEHLFQPFYRSQAAREQAGGIGIGLTVCRRIVEVLNGRMWVAHRPGGGAIVGFALPRATMDMEHDAPD
jgi:two-component system sensor histidine kinase KdpD